MSSRPTVVRFHPVFRLFALFTTILSLKVLQLSVVPPETIQGAGERAFLIIFGPLLFFASLWAALRVFTFRQEWSYEGVSVWSMGRARHFDTSNLKSVTMRTHRISTSRGDYEFDLFDLTCSTPEGPMRFALDYGMVGAGNAKKILNQWAALRPNLVHDSDLLDFLASKPGWRERAASRA